MEGVSRCRSGGMSQKGVVPVKKYSNRMSFPESSVESWRRYLSPQCKFKGSNNRAPSSLVLEFFPAPEISAVSLL